MTGEGLSVSDRPPLSPHLPKLEKVTSSMTITTLALRPVATIELIGSYTARHVESAARPLT